MGPCSLARNPGTTALVMLSACLLQAPLLLQLLLLQWTAPAAAMRQDRLVELRRETVSMFYHGYKNYMEHAFPEDELRPVSCTPLTRDRSNPVHYGINDVLGNYSLTLIDSLSTLAILAGGPTGDAHTGSQALLDFQDGIAKYVKYYGDGRPGPSGQGIRARGFDLDSKVQVFETVIRGVGGLLSAHLFAIGELPIAGYDPGPFKGKLVADDPVELVPISWPNGFNYDGQLLRLALDLAQRLLPAFYTQTGLPYPRVNLRHGIPFYTNSPLHKNRTAGAKDSTDSEGTEHSDGPPERTETCSAGAGSLVLEFTTLSRLTGDSRFEQLGKRAFWEVWDRRSDIGLVGNRLDPEGGQWLDMDTGIGAGIDSFFEYALKSHILLSGQGLPNLTMPDQPIDGSWMDPNSLYAPLAPEKHSPDAFLEAWHKAHAAVKRHLLAEVHHPHYVTGHLRTGSPVALWIDSLGAFYPGLLTLAGEVEEAVTSNLLYTALWTRYAALPERWNFRDNAVWSGIGWWPGRPEFIESTYHLYRATKDPWYLYVGEMVLRDIHRRCYTECGWSGLQDVRNGEKMDRMESFFLGETAKYMYLLFDPEHALNKLDAAYVFTTEGHPLLIPRKPAAQPQRREAAAKKELSPYYDESFTTSCPAPPKHIPLTGSVTATRADIFHASSFTNLHLTPNIHGEIEAVEFDDPDEGIKTRYRAKTNYTYFPWTLPQEMLPEDGICATLPGRQQMTIEFPASMQDSGLGSAFNQMFGSSTVTRFSHEGVYVHSLSQLRLTLVMDDAVGPDYEHTWRVTSVNNMALGRDEVVYIDADLVAQMSDPLFNRVRHPSHVDVVLAYTTAPAPAANGSETAAAPSTGFEATFDETRPAEQLLEEAKAGIHESRYGGQSLDSDYKSLLKSIVRAVTSVFDPSATPGPDAAPDQPALHAQALDAALPVGRGAVLMPDIPDAPPVSATAAADVAAALPWHAVYLAGRACDAPIPEAAVRAHQVIVMRRGGCSFSEKLANVPSFAPAAAALQLVVMVDEDTADDEYEALGLVRPRLDEEQLTPSGMRRHHPIPMVMVRGRETYDLFHAAVGVGFRRRYYIQIQGLKADNIHII